MHRYGHLGTCGGKCQTPSPHRRPQPAQPCPPACLPLGLLRSPSFTVRENLHHGGHPHVDTMSHISFPSLNKFLSDQRRACRDTGRQRPLTRKDIRVETHKRLKSALDIQVVTESYRVLSHPQRSSTVTRTEGDQPQTPELKN